MTKLTLPNRIILFKDLPSCPSGTCFIKTFDGSHYYNILGDISNDIKQYVFSTQEILDNLSPTLDKTFFIFDYIYISMKYYAQSISGLEDFKIIWTNYYNNWLYNNWLIDEIT